MNIIWQNDLVYIEQEASQIPWLKVFTKRKVKEFSECTLPEKQQIWRLLDSIEKTMLEYYQCDKVNIASFGNMLPQVHWHIMARFKSDNYFPNPMWGEKLRDSELHLPDFDEFLQILIKKL
jgi:diadenosine tetraphosphate (Ap4A) HIT family hydrolase